MKTKMIFIILSYLLLAFRCSKEECHQTIHIRNESDNIIYTQRIRWYSDTLFHNHFPNPIQFPYSYEVKPGEENQSALKMRSCYEGLFRNKDYMPHDTLCIFIFDPEVLSNYEWDDISKNQMVLQRYDVSLEDMQRLDWHVTYPPDIRMKNVKMYPPYKE